MYLVQVETAMLVALCALAERRPDMQAGILYARSLCDIHI